MANILIVEDESIIARDVADRLEHIGHAVSAIVDSGEEAIEQAIFGQPDLVLMDIVLHGDMDGIEAAERIQTDLNIPVVYLTAYADPETLRRVKFTEPFGYILKPFRDQDFDATVEIALCRFRAQSRLLRDVELQEELVSTYARYIALVAHEFRKPLADIQTSTDEIYQQGDRSTADQRLPQLKRVQIALTHMRQLLRDVESFSDTQTLLTFNPAPLNLFAFCQELMEELRLALQTETVISLILPSEPLPARMDQRLLRHILTNLLSNAIKYSPQGSTVRFEVTYSTESSETIASADSSTTFRSAVPVTVIFRICDQGIGIPFADQQRLFEAFYRAGNVRYIPGIGMGLAIAKRCTELHLGTLTFISDNESGSIFTVALPLWSEN